MPSDLDFAGPLREALLAADFTYDRVAEAIGEEAHRALGRNETLPALRRTTSGAPIDTLVRLFLLQTPVAARRRGAGAPRPGRPALQRRPAGAERQRGRGPDRLPALRHLGGRTGP